MYRTLIGVVGGEEYPGVLERNVDLPPPATQVVDQLIAGDRVSPGREGQGTVIAVTLQMHREQRLLHQVLDLRGAGPDTAGEVAAQMATERAQELPMRGGIALEAADHQWPEALFSVDFRLHGARL